MATSGGSVRRMEAPRALAIAAERYLARGFAVVPVHGASAGGCSCGRTDCPSPGKRPRVRWQRYVAARPTAARVRAWWRRWPEANIGVVTGRVSVLLVLDVDPRNGGEDTLAALVAVHGPLPPTPEVRTGGGGRHCWFAIAEVVASGPVGAGLDVKAEGGMAIAPPSRHVSGGSYRWTPGRGLDDRPLAPAPAWLVQLAGRRLRPGATIQDAGHRPGTGVAVLRTPGERAAFLAAWERAGLALRPGDHAYLCPFHDDHRPSLHIDAEGCRWYCFGCGRGGGIGALRRQLAERGEPLPRARLTRLPTDHDPEVTLPGDHEVDVIGEGEFQDALLALTGGVRRYGGVDVDTVAQLVLGASREAGPPAGGPVAVQIRGTTVGWLRDEDASRHVPAIAAAIAERGMATCRARIRGGWDRGAGKVGAFGVRLFLPAPPA